MAWTARVFRDSIWSNTAPGDTTKLWMDTSTTPWTPKEYNGSAWVAASGEEQIDAEFLNAFQASVVSTQTSVEANLPSSTEKSALAGTTGTPGNANRYVTDTDTRNTNARTPTTHTHAAADVTSGTLTTSRIGSGSPAAGMYVDGATGAWTLLPSSTVSLFWKNPVRVATTANITLSGTQTIDGVALVAGNRVLVKNQTTGSQNGIYDVAAGAWTRSTDADTSAEVAPGTIVAVTEGTTLHDTVWLLTNDTVTLGTTALSFTQFAITSNPTASQVSFPQSGNLISTDVGAALVELDTEKSATGHVHAGADITSGTVDVARIGTGTKDTSTFYRGDGSFAIPSGSGSGSVSWKDPVRVATTANITLSGTQTVDGITLVAGERVLVKNQTTGSQNGIYLVASGAWGRATDASSSGLLPASMVVAVSEGSANADTLWQLSTNAPITLGTTALSFSSIAGGTSSSIPTATTVSALKNLASVSTGSPAYLLGYYAANDGGQGLVLRDTSLVTFDEGMTFAHNTESGGWSRLEEATLLVDKFGVNAGSTQVDRQTNHTRISAAIAYGVARGMEVEFGNKEYLIEGTGLPVPIPTVLPGSFSGRWLITGKGAPVIRQYSSNVPILRIQGLHQHNFEISRLQLDYNARQTAATNPNSVCIRLEADAASIWGTWNFHIHHCRFYNAYRGITQIRDVATQKEEAWGIFIDHCWADFSMTGALLWARPDNVNGAPNIQVTNTYIHRDPSLTGAAAQEPSIHTYLADTVKLDGVEVNDGNGRVFNFESSGNISLFSTRLEGCHLLTAGDDFVALADCTAGVRDFRLMNCAFDATTGRQYGFFIGFGGTKGYSFDQVHIDGQTTAGTLPTLLNVNGGFLPGDIALELIHYNGMDPYDSTVTMPTSKSVRVATLGTDVINNNATANTYADVTGLTFPVIAGRRYNFRAQIVYSAAATTTGSRWAVNGPATPTLLAYTVQMPPATTTGYPATPTLTQYATYDAGTVTASTPATTNNLAIIEGTIIPATTGTVALRFASEVSGSAITAKAGSTLQVL